MNSLLKFYAMINLLPFIWNVVSANKQVASFYGSSYIMVPLKEAKDTTEVHLRFRTGQPNGLLLLAAGATDYCVLYLDGGHLKLKINLGAGESELTLAGISSYLLNDLHWHQVSVHRNDANISFTVDHIHSVQKHLVGDFFELNIYFGVFIGGKGDFNELFLGHLENFRGCISELNYNGLYLLEQTKNRIGQNQVHSITWNCASEFDTNAEREISFVENSAFMVMLPTYFSSSATTSSLSTRNTFKLEIDIRTIVDQCILFYSSGFANKFEILLLELWHGKVVFTVRERFGIELNGTNETPVSNGQWHHISLTVADSGTFDLTVDGIRSVLSRRRISSHTNGFVSADLPDYISIGGIETEKRARKGFMRTHSRTHFKGCIRNVYINGHRAGLQHAKVTEGIKPDCIWKYPCVSSNRCSLTNTTCIQDGFDSFHCQCKHDSHNCNHTSYKMYSNSSWNGETAATHMELLSVKALEVNEGENILITSAHLHLLLDYHKYGIRESGILFHIIEAPVHGQIYIDLWPRKQNVFTMLDLARDKVHYMHDGQESRNDQVVIDLELSSDDTFILPAYLQGKSRFVLPVLINPVNDPPILDIPNSSVLRIAQGAEEILSNELLHVIDPDTVAEKLIYTIMPQDLQLFGHFERIATPKNKVVVLSFSQQDVNEKRIKFIHHGYHDNENRNNFNIPLQVSDGIGTSKVAFLRISVFIEHLLLKNNTGVLLVYNSTVFLTPTNLSIISNVNANVNVIYHIQTPPHFGVIEVEKQNDHWEPVTSFTQIQMKQNRVRYKHIGNDSSTFNHDEFKFFASSLTTNNISSAVYSFRMTFINFNLINEYKESTHYLLNGTLSFQLNRNKLKFRTESLYTNPLLITYCIIETPIYGMLVIDHKQQQQQRLLNKNDCFTQEDINLNNIQYRLYKRSYSNVTDVIQLIVGRGIVANSHIVNISFIYIVQQAYCDQIRAAILVPLHLTEGNTMSIMRTNLDLIIDGLHNLMFNITVQPKHGLIQVNNKSVNYFTQTELYKGIVSYSHDDSETRLDSFSFLAITTNPHENGQYSGRLDIYIKLKNDNSPMCSSVNTVLHVVSNGTKLITADELYYMDADIDTEPANIIYSCRQITNGILFLINEDKDKNEQIQEFTQAHINNNSILFRHQGDSNGQMKFTVTDGLFYVDGYLIIQASKPFIKVLNTKQQITLKQASSVFITTQHLQIVTNLNVNDENILYRIINKLKYGNIRIGNNQNVKEFSHFDVKKQYVAYVHDGNSLATDEMKMKVYYQATSHIAILLFRILPESYWKPLILISVNRTIIYVEESTSIVVMKESLHVTQFETAANQIIYHVIEPPQYGYLDIISNANLNSSQFSQEDINQKNIHYVQSSANKSHDRIVFNVTNGIVWLNEVTLDVIVIPEHVYLDGRALEVYEGSNVTLSFANIFVATDYYRNTVTNYLITVPPAHGCLKKRNRCITTSNFSHQHLENGFIHYSHDNSETSQDQISVIGVMGQKQTVPFTIHIKVLPVNDHLPFIVNNSGLHMWEGGLAAITNDLLAVVDHDEPKETLTYNIKECIFGNILTVNKNETSDAIVESFTQRDIDQHHIIFQHTNGSDAKCVFTITDGLHTTKDVPFRVTTKPVTLTISKLTNVHVFPLQSTYITAINLLSNASDSDRLITYSVTTLPTLGRIIVIDTEIPNNVRIVNTFTQLDVNSNQVLYEHVHPISGLYANDFFIFDIQVERSTSIIRNLKMMIDISVSFGGLDSYIGIPKVEVIEGGLTSIHLNLSEVVNYLENYVGLSVPIIHLSASHPEHGYIFLEQQHKEKNTSSIFTQYQIESGQIKYQHDHSDSQNDSLILSLFLLPDYITLCNVTILIRVIPINDQPFHLMTVAPKITVVQGENYTITSKDLLTKDLDTEPAHLKYDIITSPTQGHLIKLLGAHRVIYEVNTFTQADINANRIVYMHAGHLPQVSFYFRVWDGKFVPEYTFFNIQVIPVTINVTANLPFYVHQGSSMALLQPNHFTIRTNAAKHRLQFHVSRMPHYGVIYVRDVMVKRFHYADLRDKYVFYKQTNMSSANDSFQLFISVSSISNSVVVDVFVQVQPLMKISNLSVITGTNAKLTLQVLDASQLAKQTNSNPRYLLIDKPIYGVFRKIIRSSGEKRNVIDEYVDQFTHDEIKSGQIYYVSTIISNRSYEECLMFSLSTNVFQPAIGELHVKLVPSSTMNTTTPIFSLIDKSLKGNLAEPQDPASHEADMYLTISNLNGNYFLLLTIITGIIVCCTVAVFIIKCTTTKCRTIDNKQPNLAALTKTTTTNNSEEENNSSTEKTEQFVPSSKRYNMTESTMPATSTSSSSSVSVPQCKVTSLLLRPSTGTIDSITNSEVDVHARYPYGISDEQMEDWSSSYDTSEPVVCSTHNMNLMLRKNQYWV